MDESLDVSHLFMLDAFDDERLTDGEHQWSQNRDVLVARYELIQQWFARQEKSQSLPNATLVVATQLGTPGGLEDGVSHPAVGGLAGLVKGIHTESRDQRQNGFHAVVVDFEKIDDYDSVAEALVDEACSATENPEIIYRSGQRFAVRPVNNPLVENLPPAEVSAKDSQMYAGPACGATCLTSNGTIRYRACGVHGMRHSSSLATF